MYFKTPRLMVCLAPLLFFPLYPPGPPLWCGASQRALFHAMLLTLVHVRRTTPYELFTGLPAMLTREFIIRRFFFFFFQKKNVGTNQQTENPAEHVERGGWFAPPRKNQKVKICDYDRGGGGEGRGQVWGISITLHHNDCRWKFGTVFFSASFTISPLFVEGVCRFRLGRLPVGVLAP